MDGRLTLCDDANGHDVQAVFEPRVVVRRARHAAADALYDEADDVGKREQDGVRLGSEKGVFATGNVSASTSRLGVSPVLELTRCVVSVSRGRCSWRRRRRSAR
jgi:hypothetical protein